MKKTVKRNRIDVMVKLLTLLLTFFIADAVTKFELKLLLSFDRALPILLAVGGPGLPDIF